jgi:hypothetical protein
MVDLKIALPGVALEAAVADGKSVSEAVAMIGRLPVVMLANVFDACRPT